MEHGPFDVGARYEVVSSFEAMRDRFVAGEVMWYSGSAYGRHEGVYGFFFRQPGARVRSWDVSTVEEAHATWQAHFRRAAPPHALMEAASRDAAEIDSGDLASSAEVERELALEAAAEQGHASFVSALLTASPTSAEHQRRLLSEAARKGSAAVVAALLSRGVPPDEPDPYGQTPLFGAVTSGDVATVELLLDAGADPERVAKSGTSPSRLAKAWKREAVVALLDARKRG